MATLATLVLFTGFYLLYNTSQRATLTLGNGWVDLIKKNQKLVKAVGCVLLITSLVLLIVLYGTGSGTLMWFIFLMTLSSLVILLSPLGLITQKTVSLVFLISFCLEIFIR